MIREGIRALTEREKETLRLLLAGHDAKSIARSLGLSVHSVNERLRDARRKLGVSSSREAARLLAGAEQDQPNSLVDKQFGLAGEPVGLRNDGQGDGPRNARRLTWIAGGMLMMSLIVSIAVVSIAYGNGSQAPAAQAPEKIAAVPGAPEPSAAGAARDWLAMLDAQGWDESWRAASDLFRSRIEETRWASIARAVRQPLGPVSLRSYQSITKAGTLPGAPPGEYQIVEFQTSFAEKTGSVESVVLVREGPIWKVAGYFIR